MNRGAERQSRSCRRRNRSGIWMPIVLAVVLASVLLLPCRAVSQMGDGSSLNPYAGQSSGSSPDSFGPMWSDGSVGSRSQGGDSAPGSGYGDWGSMDQGGGWGSRGGRGNGVAGGGSSGNAGWGGDNGRGRGNAGSNQGDGGGSGTSPNVSGIGGCNDSPENATLILAGLAAATFALMERWRRWRPGRRAGIALQGEVGQEVGVER